MNKIVILLATFNGEKYLEEQLKSVLAQTKKIDIIIRDDNSTDKTRNIIKKYMDENENIYFLEDTIESSSAKENFMILLKYALSLDKYKYFACCDQDDVWDRKKIELTYLEMKKMEKNFGEIPLLVHTDLRVVNEKLDIISNSYISYQNINPYNNSLNRLLVQNVVTGCTMMINRELLSFVVNIKNVKKIIMHDWWIALVAASFGKIGFIKSPTILYRQHRDNDTGAKKYSTSYIVDRLCSLKDINLKKNFIQAKDFLEQYRAELSIDQIKMLEKFSSIESKKFLERKKIIFQYGFFKYGWIRNIGLLIRL